MKKLNSIFFLLFLLLITGGFAAIAQNAYGMQLLGWSIAGFSFFSLLGGISAFTNPRFPKLLSFEYFTLTILFAIAAMRIFLVRFPYVELIFSGTGIVLVIIYLKYIANNFNALKDENKQLFLTLSLLYASIAMYSMALVLNPFSNFISEIAGFLGLITLILAVLSKVNIKSIVVKDKEISLTKYLSLLPNRSYLLLSLFLLFTIYSAARVFDFIPEIQSSTMPKGYYELVKEAESGKDIPLDGRYKYQEYRARMENFNRKQGIND
jgi:hypothetical protein